MTEHRPPALGRDDRDPPAAGVDRPPLLLVPGLDGTALLFYRQVPLLAEAFDVIASPLPDDRWMTMDDLVDDLRRLISDASPDGAILVGESFGGVLAMCTALEHPSLVRGLVVINSFPWLERRIQISIAPWLLRLVPWAAMPLVRTFTENRLHSSHTNEEDLAEFHTRSRHIGREGYLRRLELVRDYDIRDRLGEIEAPTLFLAADEDRLVPSERWARYMASRVPAAELRVLRGYGHICLITHDLDLRDFVEPWWEQITGQE